MDWCLGDSHGMFHTTRRLVNKIFKEDDDPTFVFLGDYVDRGFFSKQLIDYLISLNETHQCVFLLGNHDDVVQHFLVGECKSDLNELVRYPNQIGHVLWWFIEFGFDLTLKSYGVDFSDLTDRWSFRQQGSTVIERFQTAVPQAHKDFFDNLRMLWSNKTHFACHGFMPLSEKRPDQLWFSKSLATEVLWGRFSGNEDSGLRTEPSPEWDRIGVFGHTITETYGKCEPVSVGKVRLLDLGSFCGSQMAAYCCQEDRFLVVKNHSKDGRPFD